MKHYNIGTKMLIQNENLEFANLRAEMYFIYNSTNKEDPFFIKVEIFGDKETLDFPIIRNTFSSMYSAMIWLEDKSKEIITERLSSIIREGELAKERLKEIELGVLND